MGAIGKDRKIAVDSDEEVEDMPEWMKEAAKAEAEQIDQLYDAMDADGDGSVTKIEFVEVRKRHLYREREVMCAKLSESLGIMTTWL